MVEASENRLLCHLVLACKKKGGGEKALALPWYVSLTWQHLHNPAGKDILKLGQAAVLGGCQVQGCVFKTRACPLF